MDQLTADNFLDQLDRTPWAFSCGRLRQLCAGTLHGCLWGWWPGCSNTCFPPVVAAGESELPPHRSSGGGDGGAEPRPPRAPKPRALTLAGKAQHHLLTSPAGSLLPLWAGRGGRVEGALGYESGEKCPWSCSAPSAQESDIPLLSPCFSL